MKKPASAPNERLHPPEGSRVRVVLEVVGTVEGSKYNMLTGQRDLHIRLVRHPSIVMPLGVESAYLETTVEVLPSAEVGTIGVDAAA